MVHSHRCKKGGSGSRIAIRDLVISRLLHPNRGAARFSRTLNAAVAARFSSNAKKKYADSTHSILSQAPCVCSFEAKKVLALFAASRRSSAAKYTCLAALRVPSELSKYRFEWGKRDLAVGIHLVLREVKALAEGNDDYSIQVLRTLWTVLIIPESCSASHCNCRVWQESRVIVFEGKM